MSTSAATSATPKSPPLRRPLKIFREVVAIVFWLAIPIKALIIDFDAKLITRFFPDHAWIIEYRFFGLLAFFVLFSLLFGKGWFHSGLLYLAIYPLIVFLWYLPLLLLRNWAVLIAFAPAIHALYENLRTTFIFMGLAVLAAFSICVFTDYRIIIGATAVLSVYLLRHYWLDFRRAFKPSSVFVDLAGLVREAHSRVSKFIAVNAAEIAALDPASDAFRKKYKSDLVVLYGSMSCLHAAALRFQDVAKSRLLDIYLIFTVLLTFATTVLAFAFAYLGLHKLDSHHFSGVDNPGFFDFLGFSFSALMTISVSPLVATSGLSQFACYTETFCTILIFTIIVSLVLAVSRERYREDMEQVVNELRTSIDATAERFSTDFHLTEQEVELILIRDSMDFAFVNWMRRWRRMQALTQPPVNPAADVTPSLPPVPTTPPITDQPSPGS